MPSHWCFEIEVCKDFFGGGGGEWRGRGKIHTRPIRPPAHTHTHPHNVLIPMCVCVCVCVCARARMYATIKQTNTITTSLSNSLRRFHLAMTNVWDKTIWHCPSNHRHHLASASLLSRYIRASTLHKHQLWKAFNSSLKKHTGRKYFKFYSINIGKERLFLLFWSDANACIRIATCTIEGQTAVQLVARHMPLNQHFE
jgi:hypothetical protein